MTDKTCSPTALLPARVAASKRPIVVVLGMPRSGTSLLTNMLDGLGVELGENLVGADANNQAGYWEQEEICQTQEELLRHLRRRWVDPTGTMPLPSEWWRMPEIQRFKDRLAAIVSAEVSRRDQIWGFKDPRTSRLLPMWQEIFIELKFVPIYLLAIRQPESVVESMAKLYKIPASRVELLWLLHNLDAVRDTGDKLRLVVDYDLWFTQPEKQARTFLDALGLRWNGTTAELLAGVCHRIRPDLRHCRTDQQLSLPFLSETFSLLKQAAATGRIPEELRRVDEEVRRAFSLGQPWAAAVEEMTGTVAKTQYSFVEHFADGRLESLGNTARAGVWDAQIDGPMERAIFLHPPARLCFRVPDGRRTRLTFAVNVHPHAWDKPKAGGCEFMVAVDGAVTATIRVNPVQVMSDRRWHECTLDIPESASGVHEITFETRALGKSLDFRWAVWREPRLTWETFETKQAEPAPALKATQAAECLARADAAYRVHDLSTACVALKEALTYTPNAISTLVCLGNVQFQLVAFADAFQSFKRAAEIKPNDSDILIRLATAAERCNDITQYLQALWCALEIEPRAPHVLRLAIKHDVENGNFAKGAQKCCALIQSSPNELLLLLQFGKCLREIGDMGSARWCYERSLEVDPTCAIAHEVLPRLTGLSGTSAHLAGQLKACSTPIE